MRVLASNYLIPFDQMCLFKRVSILTSLVPISFSANLRISLMARGARFLKPMLCTRLAKWMVHSRVVTSLMADLLRFSPFALTIFVYLEMLICYSKSCKSIKNKTKFNHNLIKYFCKSLFLILLSKLFMIST